MKFTKTGNKATIKFSDGIVIMLSECSEDDFEFLSTTDDENAVKQRFVGELVSFEYLKKKVDQSDDSSNNEKNKQKK